jgi:hypothetical protein
MQLDDLVKRADELIALGEAALRSGTMLAMGYKTSDGPFSEFAAPSQSFLDRTFGVTSAYSEQFRRDVWSSMGTNVQHGIGILKGARGELAGGWMRTTRGLISGEVFGDFLEMGEHLLDEHYKDAAAVMIGGTLEEHLRQVATENGVAVEELKNGKMIPRKADAINADLAKSTYGKLDQKNVTAWLDLRNKAAHAHYSEYNEDQVRTMLGGVREFIVRVRL